MVDHLRYLTFFKVFIFKSERSGEFNIENISIFLRINNQTRTPQKIFYYKKSFSNSSKFLRIVFYSVEVNDPETQSRPAAEMQAADENQSPCAGECPVDAGRKTRKKIKREKRSYFDVVSESKIFVISNYTF